MAVKDGIEMPDKFEMSRMQEIKISVVTVCLNTANTIKETVNSVLEQSYGNLEYVIVDGMSTDGTLEIIREYERSFGVKVISDKDSGLYNAMNKGIDLCSGDYILFLNSGDILADKHVVENAAAQICGRVADQADEGSVLPDLVYGNVIKIYEDKTVTEKYPGKYTVFKLLMMGRMPCHQGIFAKTSVMKKFRFDESYRICADFDFLLRCVHDRIGMRYIDVNVSTVDCLAGISSQKVNLDKMRAEDDRSIRENYPVLYWLMWIPKKIVRMKSMASILVDIVSVVDLLLIRMRNRTSGTQNKDIVLVRLDAIGDFVMWLDAAKEFRRSTDGRVILICNQVCSEIASNTGYFDEIIGVNYGKLRHTSQVKYRWSVHHLLKKIKANQAVQCTYSKEIFSDMVMSAVAANEKITIDSPETISSRWTYRLAGPIYQKVIVTPKAHVMEIHRNILFAGQVLNREIRSGVPLIKEVKTAQSKVPAKKYFILFPGASEPERMWQIDRFVELAMRLHESEEYRELSCCLCGGKEEAHLGNVFIDQYPMKEKVINRMGQTSLPELIEIIRGAEFMVTNDTSAVHFAAAVNTQAFCIWGPWEYGRFLPYEVELTEGRNLPIVCYHDMKCRNCLLDGVDKTAECRQYIREHGIRKCLDAVTVEDVMERIESGH